MYYTWFIYESLIITRRYCILARRNPNSKITFQFFLDSSMLSGNFEIYNLLVGIGILMDKLIKIISIKFDTK